MKRLLKKYSLVEKRQIGRGYSKTFMHICTHNELGINVAIMEKPPGSIFRDGNSLNKARVEETTAWMIDEAFVPMLAQRYDVKAILFFDKGNEDIWASDIADWLDESKRYHSTNPNARESIDQAPLARLSIELMRHYPGKTNLLVR